MFSLPSVLPRTCNAFYRVGHRMQVTWKRVVRSSVSAMYTPLSGGICLAYPMCDIGCSTPCRIIIFGDKNFPNDTWVPLFWQGGRVKT